ncbi:beta-ketoacyl reductase, partial [Streptomyces sp. NPDC058847]|uniref:type I polyketide synthase n=1 Tax=Streptomyces sp. NPDC058847 TaxID=3346649 RepID=UPI0036AFC075
RDHDDHHAFHTALAHLHTHHHTITWPTTTPTHHQPHLPTYPFERHSYWLTPPKPAAARVNGPALLRLRWNPLPHPATTAALPANTALLTHPLTSSTHQPPANAVTDAVTDLVPATAHYRTLADLTHALDHGTPTPDTVLAVLPHPTDDLDSPTHTHHHLTQTLTLLQTWLTDDRHTTTNLVILTHHATTTHPHESPHPTQAAITALIRTAQTEHPHRITIIDLDTHPTSPTAIPHALTHNEPQLAIRNGQIHTPRLTRLPDTPTPAPTPWNPDGTVLITGGTGTLAAHTARHLTTHHHIRHLLLISRTGPNTPTAHKLKTELEELGATVTLAACDIADQKALEALLAQIPDQHPLTAVVHTAGLIDMAPLQQLTPQQLTTVLHPKINGAWNLHQATRHLTLDAFILYSSLAATLASPGQANYAAANAYLDALAHHRHTQGLPATSLAWGPWNDEAGMIRHLNPTTRQHTTRTGFPPLTTTQAITLLDTALTTHQPTTTATNLNTTHLTPDTTPTLLTELTPTQPTTTPTTQPTTQPTTLQEQLQNLDEQTRYDHLLTLVRTTIATVLAHPDPHTINPHQPF